MEICCKVTGWEKIGSDLDGSLRRDRTPEIACGKSLEKEIYAACARSDTCAVTSESCLKERENGWGYQDGHYHLEGEADVSHRHVL